MCRDKLYCTHRDVRTSPSPQEPSLGLRLLHLDPQSRPLPTGQPTAQTSARATLTPSPSSEGKSLYLRCGVALRPVVVQDSSHLSSISLLVFMSLCRTSGFGACVTTKCCKVTRCPSVTSGKAFLQTSMPPTRGMMGNLSSSRVRLF